MVRRLEPVENLRVHWFESAAGTQHHLGTSAGADLDTEELIERGGNLAVGQTGTLVEIDHGRLGIGTELALGGAGRVAGLQGMATAISFATALAVAAVNVEPPHDGPAGNLRLVLHIDMHFDNHVATVVTAIGQRRFVDFVYLAGWWRRSMAVPAVLVARLAAGLLGILFGRVARERRGLPFGGAFGGIETLLQIAIGLHELLDSAILLCHPTAQLFVFGPQFSNSRCVHADLGRTPSRQLTEIIEVFAAGGKMALNKHEKCCLDLLVMIYTIDSTWP